MVVPYASFGVQNERLYSQYLLTSYVGRVGCDVVADGEGVHACDVAGVACGGVCGQPLVSVGGIAAVRAFFACGVDGRDGKCGFDDGRLLPFGVRLVGGGGKGEGVVDSGAVPAVGCEGSVQCNDVGVGADPGGIGGPGCVSAAGVKSGHFGAPRGPVTLPRGPNFSRNQSSRLRKKAQKQARRTKTRVDVEQVGVVAKTAAQQSLESLWQARNEMEIAKLARERRVMEATDLQQVIKQKRARLLKMTERDLVAVEKAHKQLEQSGNVPGVVPGFAETLVDSDPSTAVSGTPVSGGTISPNSSISQAEVQQLMKDFADMKAQQADVQAQNAVLSRALLKMGIDPRSPDECKNTWTLASNGDPVELEIMDDLGLDGYVPDVTAGGKAVVRLRAQGFY